ncbi:MAG: membrane protein insertase YidC [Gammaproteobacteria bacterium]|nr:membrane protein insertase YidC [Gammaproteobacteria bacterium]MBQ0839271.1 membrane protein insertase YidC [Gammaproteobacteria bacterium]
MDWQRSALIAAIVVVFGLLFIRWNEYQEEHAPVIVETSNESVLIPPLPEVEALAPEIQQSGVSAIPELLQRADHVTTEDTPNIENARLVTVVSDVLQVTIDTLGGDIVRVTLPQHPVSQEPGAEPFVMLNRTQNQTYIAQSGLIGQNGTDTAAGRPRFSVSQAHYELLEGDETVVVDLLLKQDGASLTKRFTFKRNDYLIDVAYLVDNHSSEVWQAHLFGQIQRDSYNPVVGNSMAPNTYLGAALTTDEEKYKKLDFSDMEEGAFKTEKLGGWVAMVQHYFISAWVPDQTQTNSYQLRKLGSKDLYTMGFTSAAVEVAPGDSGELRAAFYVGPKDQYLLEELSPYLDLTIDYGWLWWVAKPLFYGLTMFHGLVGNWGWSIIFLTFLVKLLFFPLSAASYKSMARMRKLQPEMARLKELYGDDRQKMSQEMMAFYKKEKVNPMGGCLPMLIQMPVFIALYWVLNESVELRHSPFIFWLTDLSQKDPYYVLPVLNGISMFVLQTLQPAPPDPIQAKVMRLMPVAFSFFFMFFPAGLVLYWTVNSILSIVQQWTITRKIIRE